MERKINYVEFIDNSKKTVFENSYYACLKDANPVKNTIKLKKNSFHLKAYVCVAGPDLLAIGSSDQAKDILRVKT